MELYHAIQQDQSHKYAQTTLDFIVNTIDAYGLDSVSICFNGGKDCTVLLHLLAAALTYIRQRDGIPLRYSSYNGIPISMDDTVIDIPVVYFKVDREFDELYQFNNDMMDMYKFKMVEFDGTDMKQCLNNMLDYYPKMKAIFMGQRLGDPGSQYLSPVQHSDPGWPLITRVNAILNWTYAQVWQFLISFQLPYCRLYELGYTSLGTRALTLPNPALLKAAIKDVVVSPASTCTSTSTYAAALPTTAPCTTTSASLSTLVTSPSACACSSSASPSIYTHPPTHTQLSTHTTHPSTSSPVCLSVPSSVPLASAPSSSPSIASLSLATLPTHTRASASTQTNTNISTTTTATSTSSLSTPTILSCVCRDVREVIPTPYAPGILQTSRKHEHLNSGVTIPEFPPIGKKEIPEVFPELEDSLLYTLHYLKANTNIDTFSLPCCTACTHYASNTSLESKQSEEEVQTSPCYVYIDQTTGSTQALAQSHTCTSTSSSYLSPIAPSAFSPWSPSSPAHAPSALSPPPLSTYYSPHSHLPLRFAAYNRNSHCGTVTLHSLMHPGIYAHVQHTHNTHYTPTQTDTTATPTTLTTNTTHTDTSVNTASPLSSSSSSSFPSPPTQSPFSPSTSSMSPLPHIYLCSWPYLPAYVLADANLERAGRIPKPKPGKIPENKISEKKCPDCDKIDAPAPASLFCSTTTSSSLALSPPASQSTMPSSICCNLCAIDTNADANANASADTTGTNTDTSVGTCTNTNTATTTVSVAGAFFEQNRENTIPHSKL